MPQFGTGLLLDEGNEHEHRLRDKRRLAPSRFIVERRQTQLDRLRIVADRNDISLARRIKRFVDEAVKEECQGGEDKYESPPGRPSAEERVQKPKTHNGNLYFDSGDR